jgi:MFS family permease
VQPILAHPIRNSVEADLLRQRAAGLVICIAGALQFHCGAYAISGSLNCVSARDSSPFRRRSKSIQESGNGAALGSGAGSAAGRLARRLGPLRHRNFRVFYIGYTTSLLGSAMSVVALTFAVLDSGGGPADLGLVFAASVVPQVLVMIGGGVLADRVARRRVMLVTDTLRVAVQGTLAAALFIGRPSVWVFMVLAGLGSTCQGLFTPALGGLQVEVVARGQLSDANALLGVAVSATGVIGPALAGVLISVTSPAVVIAIDAASFGVSVLSLALLAVPPGRPPAQSPWRDLVEGWAVFRSQTWLWLITVQFALFNLFTWAPYLLLGPILARQYLGGARAWGIISAAIALGSVLTGLVLVGRRPRRILVVAVTGTFGYALPCLALAAHAPLSVVVTAALAAGVGSTVFNTYESTVMQQRIAPELLGRATSLSLTGAYALGSCGFAVIGSIAMVIGPSRLLYFAAAYSAISSAVVLATPAIRAVRWLDTPPSADRQSVS